MVFRKLYRRAKRGPGQRHTASPAQDFGPSPRRRKAAFGFFASILVLIVSGAARSRLPPAGDVLPVLQQPPVQQAVAAHAFETTVAGQSYTVVPRYRYELWGLVVSRHESDAWGDIYHRPLWKDFINVADVCVVWGENLAGGSYRSVDFRSDSWTCYASTRDPEAWGRFHPDQLSNNHLLVDRESLSRRVAAAREGDQVYLRGYLADYKNRDWEDYRRSSVVRTDVGDGACEAVYLEDFRILKRANAPWRCLFWLGWAGLVVGGVGWFVLE